MANNYATITSNAVDLPKIWAPELNTAVQFDIVAAALFDNRYEDIMRVGNIVSIPGRRNLATSAKSAQTDFAIPAVATETAQNFTINTHIACAFGIDDIAEVQSLYDLRATYTDAAAYAIARDLDSRCLDATVGIGSSTTNTVGTGGAELTDDNLISAWKTLANNACPLGDRYTVVAPATYAGFLKVDKFVNALYNGDTQGMAVHEAKVGNLYNSEVYVSQLTSGSAPTSNGAMFHRSHWLLIRQRTPTVHMEYRAVSVGWTVLVDQIYGVFERLEYPEGGNTGTNVTAAVLWDVQLLSVQ